MRKPNVSLSCFPSLCLFLRGTPGRRSRGSWTLPTQKSTPYPPPPSLPAMPPFSTWNLRTQIQGIFQLLPILLKYSAPPPPLLPPYASLFLWKPPQQIQGKFDSINSQLNCAKEIYCEGDQELGPLGADAEAAAEVRFCIVGGGVFVWVVVLICLFLFLSVFIDFGIGVVFVSVLGFGFW